MKVKSLSRVGLFATPWTAAYQAPPSMGFSRQECWSGVPLPSLLVITNAEKLLCDRYCGEPFTHTDLFDAHDILSYFIDKETEVQRGKIMCLRFYTMWHDEDMNLLSLTSEPTVNGI